MKNYKECIVSWKYNDIFYGLSVSKVTSSKERILIVIKTKNYGIVASTYIKEFDRIIYIENDSNSTLGFLQVFYRLFVKLRGCYVEKLLLSNPVLVINQFICKFCSVKEVYLLEDGLMNYCEYIPSSSSRKRVLQKILGISDEFIYNLIKRTYLLKPEYVVFSKGSVEKLNFSSSNFSVDTVDIIDKIKGKSIFIGMPLYNVSSLSLEKYNECVNTLMKIYNIDYYMPHLFSSSEEDILGNKFNLEGSGLTLEMLSSYTEFVIYSFGSSISYTTKLINPKIISTVIKLDEVKFSEIKIIRDVVDQVIDLNGKFFKVN